MQTDTMRGSATQCAPMRAVFGAVMNDANQPKVSDCPGWPRHRLVSPTMQSRDFARIGVHSDAQENLDRSHAIPLHHANSNRAQETKAWRTVLRT